MQFHSFFLQNNSIITTSIDPSSISVLHPDLKQAGTTSNQLAGGVLPPVPLCMLFIALFFFSLSASRVLSSFCLVPEEPGRSGQIPFIRRLLLFHSPSRRRRGASSAAESGDGVVFGLSGRLRVSVSGATASSDSAGGAAGSEQSAAVTL